jgi:CheY-like chemotaxis protein
MIKTIMVVDDEPDTRESIVELVNGYGYRAIPAVDGDDCLRKLKKIKPDLILMDIMMPGTPVKQVIKKIKKTPILIVSVIRTSTAQKSDLLSEENIVGFVQKPFGIVELIEKVKEALGE